MFSYHLQNLGVMWPYINQYRFEISSEWIIGWLGPKKKKAWSEHWLDYTREWPSNSFTSEAKCIPFKRMVRLAQSILT